MIDVPPALMDVLVGDCIDREADIPHMYLDVKGLVTTGVGKLLHSAYEASQLPFMLGDRRATVAEISSEFVRVQGLPAAMGANFYRTPTSPLLPDGYARDLCQTELRSTYLPGVIKLVPDLLQRPPEVARALVTIAYCAGLNGLAHFPKMLAAIRAGDYATAAVESHMDATDATNGKLVAWLTQAGMPATS